MEKLLLAVDNDPVDENAVDFACHLARLTQSRLTGIFLNEPVTEPEVVIESQRVAHGVTSITIAEFDQESEQAAQHEENIAIFREWAERSGVSFNVYLDKGVPVTELSYETRYADMLLMSADTFSQGDEPIPSAFVKQLIHDSACPVILTPESFERIDNIFFCYDGSKSSLFAIKQFAYLFPQLRSQRVKVISLAAERPQPTEQARVTQWLGYHYSDVEWIAQGAEAAEALFHYLLKKRDDFVVMGAYGHGLLTSFFEPDYETGTIHTTSLPIFIAHC
jgi:nucleotide-binding universal stress UspA family protein